MAAGSVATAMRTEAAATARRTAAAATATRTAAVAVVSPNKPAGVGVGLGEKVAACAAADTVCWAA